MSISTFFAHLFGTQNAAVDAAPATTVAAVKAFGSSEASKIVAALKTTDIGAAVAADVAAVQSTNQTGEQKFAAVLSNTIPLIVKYASGGGITALEADVEGIARALVQEVYVDVADTGFGKIAGDFAKLLGI